MDSLEPGTLLARRYRLLDRIGVGGMSVIWRAHDEMLERGVAVKVLASDLAADSRFRDLVRTEARAAAALVHPHVTATFDYGETVNSDGEVTAYVVMELLEGEPLSARLTAGPLPWTQALRTCAEVAEALAAAHRHGIVHRDITSDNVMLTIGGAKILDFGIATTVGAPDEDTDGMTFGTPAYVAPERLDGRRARPATDTYALGVLLFETLTGQPPYPAETWEELNATSRDEPPALEVAGLPDDVASLCRQCLASEPRERPTASQVAWTLRRHLPGASRGGGTRARRALAAVGAAAGLAVGVLVGTTLLSPNQTMVTHPPAADSSSAPAASPLAEPAGAPAPTGSPQPGPSDAAEPGSEAPGPGIPGVPGPGQPDPSGPGFDSPFSGAPDYRVPGDTVTLSTVSDLVAEGEARDDIRDDVAQDLNNLIANLERDLETGSTDLSTATELLREKVRTRADEGTLGEESATELEAALDELTT